jgi:RNA polymerase sigma factor (sigma-70 family)
MNDELVAPLPRCDPSIEAGDADADAALLDALRPSIARMQRIALALAGNSADAEDLVAEALARILPRWRSHTIDDPAAYLKTTIVNLSTRRWRRRALSRSRDHRALDWLAAADDDPGRAALDRQVTLTAVRLLSPRRRAIVVLRYYDDLSLEQIANVLEINVGTVKSQLWRALEQLRLQFEGQGR